MYKKGPVLPVVVRVPEKMAGYFMAEADKGRSFASIGLELFALGLKAKGIEVE